MKKYQITLSTSYGSLTIDIEAESEEEAFDKACEEAKAAINRAKLDESRELH